MLALISSVQIRIDLTDVIINDVIRGQKLKEFRANCSDTLQTCQVLLFGIFLHTVHIFLIGFILQIQKQPDNSSGINIKGENKAIESAILRQNFNSLETMMLTATSL